MIHTAFIALGSNLGDREKHLREAVDSLIRFPGISLSGLSPIYETEPVGVPDQNWYLNGAVRIFTDLTPLRLLDLCQWIEEQGGRDRSFPAGPRTIDLDLLLFDDRVIDTSRLRLPHPRLHLRSFVLTPLADLDPAYVHPVLKKTVRRLLAGLEDPHVIRRYREVSVA
jgi:2-amino-4-hydroxy-6-hydroxymethyldihydropteridine diphosphokinase